MKKFFAGLVCASSLLITQAFAENVFGDINIDGKVDITDVVLIRSFVVGNIELTNEQSWYADVNGDEAVNISDVVIIRSAIVNSAEIEAPNREVKTTVYINNIEVVSNGVAYPELMPKGITYNNGILALTDVEISSDSEAISPLLTEGDVEIQLYGNNKIISSKSVAVNCAYGNVTFSGSGTLTASGTAGIYCDGIVYVKGAQINSSGTGLGLFGGYGVDISGGKVTAFATDAEKSYGIASGEFIDITGGEIEARGNTAAMAVIVEQVEEKPSESLLNVIESLDCLDGKLVSDEYISATGKLTLAYSFGNENFAIQTDSTGAILGLENAEKTVTIK